MVEVQQLPCTPVSQIRHRCEKSYRNRNSFSPLINKRQEENQTIFGELTPQRAGRGQESDQVGRKPRPQLLYLT